MSLSRGRAGLLCVGLAFPPAILAQETAPPDSPEADSAVDDNAATQASSPPPGRFRIGAFYLTPYFKVGSLGFDSNVNYTPTDMQADFTASGGPGHELVLPIRRASRFSVDSWLDYLYFARSDNLRKLNGHVKARLEYNSGASTDFRPPSQAWIEEGLVWTNERMSLEVDERVPRTEEGTSAHIARPLLGRLAIEVSGSRRRVEVDESVVYLENDLSRSLKRDVYAAGVGLRYYATIKTAVVATADFETSRYPLDPQRDGDLVRLLGGLETDPTALITGHALVGESRFRPRTPGLPDRRATGVDLDAMVNVTPKTRIGGGYRRGLEHALLSAPGEPSTLINEVGEVRFEKDLWSEFDLRGYYRQTRFKTDGVVSITEPDGTVTTDRRDDRSRQGGGNLGYSFRPKVRAGIEVSYTSRQSNFAYFGIEGLVVGFTVDYSP